jgi:hypothetical protein
MNGRLCNYCKGEKRKEAEFALDLFGTTVFACKRCVERCDVCREYIPPSKELRCANCEIPLCKFHRYVKASGVDGSFSAHPQDICCKSCV